MSTHIFINDVDVYRNHDDATLLACDGGKHSDQEVFIVYEDRDRNVHLHSETPGNGQLSIRLKLNTTCEQVNRHIK